MPASGKGLKNAEWVNTPASPGTPVRIILDMEQRTMSIAVGDAEPQLAYVSLPAPLRPYICSGDTGDRSLIRVY